jgi:hypothetical protein
MSIRIYFDMAKQQSWIHVNQKIIVMKNKKKFEALCKFIKSMSKSYDMTEAQWDLHQDILQKIKELNKKAKQ